MNTKPTAVALIPLSKLRTHAFVLMTCQIPCTPTVRIRPGKKIPRNESIPPKTVGVPVDASAKAPRYTEKLKLGPGNAWMTASPNRKSRGETQPGSTTYERRRGITSGPPPKMIVPARYMFENRSKINVRLLTVPRTTMTTRNDARDGKLAVETSTSSLTKEANNQRDAELDGDIVSLDISYWCSGDWRLELSPSLAASSAWL